MEDWKQRIWGLVSVLSIRAVKMTQQGIEWAKGLDPIRIQMGLWLWYYIAGLITMVVLCWQSMVYFHHHKSLVGVVFLLLSMVILVAMGLSTYGHHQESQ